MPSTRRQKAKARKCREMDMMSGFENMDVILGSDNVNPIERELSNEIGNAESHCDMSPTCRLKKMIPAYMALDIMSMKTQSLDKIGSERPWKLSLVNIT